MDHDHSTFAPIGSAAARVLDKAAAARAPLRISEPGIYNMAAAEYHADPCSEPSLSSSIAKIILDETPRHARAAHPRLNPGAADDKSSKEMNLGSVAHELLLGKGGGFTISPFDAYTTKEARAWRDETMAKGTVPIKDKDFKAAQKMADALRGVVAEVPDAGDAFLKGRAEIVAVWRDIGGPLCRAMIDWWASPVVYDLKTTGRGLSDRSLQMRIADGFDVQAAFYLRGLEQIFPDLAGRLKWRWVFVETEEPFEARIVEMDNNTRAWGDRRAALAIEKWRSCVESNRWPGYPRKIERVAYPGWAEANQLAREMVDDDALRMAVTGRPMESEPSGRMSEIVG